jgi:hypothetical protein
MKNNTWYDSFIEALYKKYPKKSQLTEVLMDLLSIERESAYRRLRKEIIFPVQEIVKITSAWNLSLDEIVGFDSKQVFFKAEFWDYLNPSLEGHQQTLQYLKSFTHIPDFEYLEVCNRMPRTLTSGFLYLPKFQILKWRYQFVNKKALSFSQIAISPIVSKCYKEYYMCIKNFANTTYIWDYMLFYYVVCTIRYFHSIYLITDEEKELIKNDLYVLMDYMSEVAAKGCWPETGNKVNLYISQINIDTHYSYYYSQEQEVKVCIVHAFVKSEIVTTNPVAVENFRVWMQLLKRSCVLISGTDEKSRIEFFMKQRQLIDTL